MSGATVAAAALAAVGAPFRLHGRDPASGLDCVGLAAHALAAAGWSGAVPSGYALRGGHPAAIAAALDRVLMRATGKAPGDVLLAATGPGQLHLAIRVADGVVHADAGLRRVAWRPGPLQWPLLGAWRTGEDMTWRR